MTLRDHRAAVRLDARVEHSVVYAQPFGRNANELEPAVGNDWKAAGQSLCPDGAQDDG